MAQNVTAAAAAVGDTRWKRLIPVAIIVYIISFMDRTNIGFARSTQRHIPSRRSLG